MPVVKNLVTPYHVASSSDLDGPAAAQMILDQIGATPLPTQADIRALIQANNSEPGFWFSDPDGVNSALNDLRSTAPAFTGGFVVSSLATANDASRLITSTLYTYQVAVAPLVYSGGHWIVVKGVQTDVDPTGSPNYSIDGFWVHNPWPNDPAPGAPSQNVWIDYSTWVATYFTPVAYGPPGGRWLNRYVCVRDPKPPAVGELEPVPRRPRADGQELLSPEQAMRLLRIEVDELGLLADEGLRAAWEGGGPDEPVLVQRHDRADALAYLFPWGTQGEVTAMLGLDARLGLLREAAVFTRPARWPPFGRQELLQRLQEGILEVFTTSLFSPSERERWESYTLRIWPGTWCLREALVWLPCWESRSPAFPFYLLSVADRHYYVHSLDGTAYDRLHVFASPGQVPQGGA